jgi:hypothetical protein
MGIALASVVESTDQAETLTVLESVEHNGKRLAVAETSSKDLVLVREHERGERGTDGKRSRENGVEHYWKRTARIADFADAVASKLLTD